MRAVIGILLLALVWLQVQLWLAPDGARELGRLRGEVRAQRVENADLTQRNDMLEAEVRDLREGLGAVEERARSDLGMIREDESFFQVVDER